MAKLLHTEKTGIGTEKWYQHTGDDGRKKITIETTADVEPLLEKNKAAYKNAGDNWKGDLHKVADIPAVMIQEFCKKNQIPFSEFVQSKTDRAKRGWKRLLNDPEFRYFRTRPGRV